MAELRNYYILKTEDEKKFTTLPSNNNTNTVKLNIETVNKQYKQIILDIKKFKDNRDILIACYEEITSNVKPMMIKIIGNDEYLRDSRLNTNIDKTNNKLLAGAVLIDGISKIGKIEKEEEEIMYLQQELITTYVLLKKILDRVKGNYLYPDDKDAIQNAYKKIIRILIMVNDIKKKIKGVEIKFILGKFNNNTNTQTQDEIKALRMLVGKEEDQDMIFVTSDDKMELYKLFLPNGDYYKNYISNGGTFEFTKSKMKGQLLLFRKVNNMTDHTQEETITSQLFFEFHRPNENGIHFAPRCYELLEKIKKLKDENDQLYNNFMLERQIGSNLNKKIKVNVESYLKENNLKFSQLGGKKTNVKVTVKKNNNKSNYKSKKYTKQI